MSEARQPRVIVSDPSDARMVNYAGILGDAWELFERKSKDYTNSGGQVFEDSGLLGQFMKMRDKISKLKKPLWDAEILRQAQQIRNVPPQEATAEDVAILNEIDLEFEGAEEIMMDLVGHCLLAISVLRERDRRDRQAKNFQQNPDGSLHYEEAPKAPKDENDPFDLEDTPLCGQTKYNPRTGKTHSCQLLREALRGV